MKEIKIENYKSNDHVRIRLKNKIIKANLLRHLIFFDEEQWLVPDLSGNYWIVPLDLIEGKIKKFTSHLKIKVKSKNVSIK